jgi:hypothetical protein
VGEVAGEGGVEAGGFGGEVEVVAGAVSLGEGDAFRDAVLAEHAGECEAAEGELDRAGEGAGGEAVEAAIESEGEVVEDLGEGPAADGGVGGEEAGDVVGDVGGGGVREGASARVHGGGMLAS